MSSSESSLGSEEWAVITIVNDSKTRQIRLMGLQLNEGKFHKPGDKQQEVLKYALDNLFIEPGEDFPLYTCGRNLLFGGGTKGSFNLFDVTGGARDFICNFAWDSPMGLKTNKAKVTAINPTSNFTVEIQEFNLDKPGALGDGLLVCTETKKVATFKGENAPGDADGPSGRDGGNDRIGGGEGNAFPRGSKRI